MLGCGETLPDDVSSCQVLKPQEIPGRCPETEPVSLYVTLGCHIRKSQAHKSMGDATNGPLNIQCLANAQELETFRTVAVSMLLLHPHLPGLLYRPLGRVGCKRAPCSCSSNRWSLGALRTPVKKQQVARLKTGVASWEIRRHMAYKYVCLRQCSELR